VPALRYGLAAAERAMLTLAFEHAAELYARCLELNEAPERRSDLLTKLADSLSCCGKGSRAAEAYLSAAELASRGQEVALVRLATSHLLRSGRFAEGEQMMGRSMHLMGIRAPQSSFGLILALVWERLRLVFRGLRWRSRSEAQIPSDLLARIDDLRSVRTDLQTLDSGRAALFGLQALRLSLQAGEPNRILDGLSGLCVMFSLRGSARGERKTDRLLTQFAALAGKLGTDKARAQLCTTQTVVAFMMARPAAVLPPSAEAQKLWRALRAEESQDSYHMRAIVSSSRIAALYLLGDFKSFRSELNEALDEARASENVAAELHLSYHECLLDELCDRSDASLARLEKQRAQLPANHSVYHLLHMGGVFHASITSANYDGGKYALQHDWPRYLRSPMPRLKLLGGSVGTARIVLLLNLLVTGESASRMQLSQIRAELAKLARTYRLFDRLLLARCALIEGDTPRALELFRACAEKAEEIYARERARYVLGTLIGGAEGDSLCAQAEQSLSEAGVVNPLSFIRPHFPEVFGARRA
jgi:hypothetical protein